MNLLQLILLAVVRLYRLLISPVLTAVFGPMGCGCRFTPTCSEYAMQAIARHGALRGALLSLQRLRRCHPWGGCGHDPVPARKFRVSSFEFPGRPANDGAENSHGPELQAARHS